MTPPVVAKIKGMSPRRKIATVIGVGAVVLAVAGVALDSDEGTQASSQSAAAEHANCTAGRAFSDGLEAYLERATTGRTLNSRRSTLRADLRQLDSWFRATCPAASPVTTTTSAPGATTSTTRPSSTTTTTAPPANTGFPDASNTGPSGQLAPSGPITTSANAQIIENVAISGDVFVNHPNVVMRNFSLTNGRIYINGATNLAISDCDLNGGGYDGAAVSEHNYSIRRCDVHGYADGLRVNGNVTIEDTWVHDFPNYIAQGAHQDAVQITSGSNIVIRHNTLHIGIDGCNAAVMIGSYSGDNILVERNLLTAACGYVAYGGDNQYSNVRYVGNQVSTLYHPGGGYFGVFAMASQATLDNNTFYDGPNAGQPAG